MDKEKAVTNKTFSQYLAEFETQLNDLFGKKAPPLPKNIKEFLVQFGPYAIVIMLFLNLPILLAAFGLSALFAPLAVLSGAGAYTSFSLGIIFMIISFTLLILALPGLFKHSLKGWRYLFYGTLFNFVYALLSGSILGALIGTAIGFYFLFQVKPLYK
jgi:hypothetical protein